jgi:Fe2+ or Zn2+ uptake regulation protein
LVLGVLGASDDHLDAEAIYERARSQEPDISLATVYRTLSVLKEMGMVEEHRLGDERGCYEPVRDDPHYHFTCVRCGEVIEFATSLVKRIERELSEQEGVRVTCAHLRLIGYCARCQSQSQADPRAIDQTHDPVEGEHSSNGH